MSERERERDQGGATAKTSATTSPERLSTDKAIIGFIVWLAVTFSAASFGSLFRPGAWYAELTKPTWNPPNSVFGPVWTILYLLMAISAWLIWREGGYRARENTLRLYLGQLVLNAMWSALFFGLHSLLGSALEITLLWFAILATLVAFWKVKPLAGALLIPYLLWVTFASVLNWTLWALNR